MAVVGFTVLGISDIGGAIIVVTSPGYPAIDSDAGWRQFAIGTAVALGGLGVGLAIGIPGVIKASKSSDEEKSLVTYYITATGGPPAGPTPAAAPAGPAPPPAPGFTPIRGPAPPPALAPATAFTVPVLSLTF